MHKFFQLLYKIEPQTELRNFKTIVNDFKKCVNYIKRNIIVFLVNISEYDDESYTYKLSNFNVRHILQLKITAEDRESEDRQQKEEELLRAQEQAATDAAQGQIENGVQQLNGHAQHPIVKANSELQQQIESQIKELEARIQKDRTIEELTQEITKINTINLLLEAIIGLLMMMKTVKSEKLQSPELNAEIAKAEKLGDWRY